MRAMHARNVRIALVALGAGCAVTQTLAVREAMAVTAGTEATVAIVFGVWLVLTAAGARVGKRASKSEITASIAFFAYATSVVATLLLARYFAVLVPVGQVPTLPAVGVGSILLLSTPCLLSGWLYAKLVRLLTAVGPHTTSQQNAASASIWAYGLDSLGGGIAGAVLAIAFLDRWLPMQVSCLACACCFIGAAAVMQHYRFLTLFVGSVACFALVYLPIDTWSYRWHAPGQHIVEAHSSPRGALLVTERDGQQQILLQRQALFVASDSASGEQIAHVVASLTTAHSRVLVIGIGPGGFLSALLAHDPQRVTVVTGDKTLSNLVKKYLPATNDPRVRIVSQDERTSLKQADRNAFDLVLVLAQAPTTVAQARLFSQEFYRDAARCLRADGKLVVTMPGFSAYASSAEQAAHSAVASTVRSVFSNVRVLDVGVALYVASAQILADPAQIAPTIEARLTERHIDSHFVTPAWLHDRLNESRIEQAERWSQLPSTASTDAHPVVYRAALSQALDRMGDGSLGVLAIAIGFAVFALIIAMNPVARPVSFSVATTGYSGLSMQLVLMLVYQTIAGALYRDIALITAAFMVASCAGALLAAWLGQRISSHARPTRIAEVVWADGVQLLVVALVALQMPYIFTFPTALGQALVLVGAVLIGVVTGAQVAMASRMTGVFGDGVGAIVYGIDLVGAAIAAALTMSVVVPALGIVGAAWLVVAVKLASFVLLRVRSSFASELRRMRISLPMIALLTVMLLLTHSATELWMTSWTSAATYQAVVWALLMWVVLVGFEPHAMQQRRIRLQRKLSSITETIGISPLKLLVFAGLLPVACLPIGRCYFSVPYVMCHACPSPCVFGLVRRYVVVVALAANIGDNRFCTHFCPLGTVQQSVFAPASHRDGTARKISRRALWMLRLIVLVLVALLYASGRDANVQTTDHGLFSAVYLNRYTVSASVLAVACVMLLASFKIRRPFCTSVCPIGTTSDLIHRTTKRMLPVLGSPRVEMNANTSECTTANHNPDQRTDHNNDITNEIDGAS